MRDAHEIRINTPEVIIRATSNGTKYAMAISTDLKAIEKKHPKKVNESLLILDGIEFNFQSYSTASCGNIHNKYCNDGCHNKCINSCF